jgi:hypothetical protein
MTVTSSPKRELQQLLDEIENPGPSGAFEPIKKYLYLVLPLLLSRNSLQRRSYKVFSVTSSYMFYTFPLHLYVFIELKWPITKVCKALTPPLFVGT